MKIGAQWQGQSAHKRTPEEDMAQRAVLGRGLGVMQHVSATDEDLFAQRLLINKGRPIIGGRACRQTVANYIAAAITIVATITIAAN